VTNITNLKNAFQRVDYNQKRGLGGQHELLKIEEPSLGDELLQEIFEVYKDLRFYLEDRVNFIKFFTFSQFFLKIILTQILASKPNSKANHQCRHRKHERIRYQEHHGIC
jgi:hypothetical protein